MYIFLYSFSCRVKKESFYLRFYLRLFLLSSWFFALDMLWFTIMVTAKPVKFVLSFKWLEKAPQAKILGNSCKILILWRKKCSFLPVFRVRWLPTLEYITQKYSAISFVVSEHHLVETKSFVFSCTLESSKNFLKKN